MMFYYYRNGQKMGPVSFEELKELVEKGGLEGEIVLENQGGDSYPAGTTSEPLSQETEETPVVVFPVVTPQSSSESTPASDRETPPFENDTDLLFKRFTGYFKKGFRRIFQKEGAITDSSSQGNPESPFSKPDQNLMIESNEPIKPSWLPSLSLMAYSLFRRFLRGCIFLFCLICVLPLLIFVIKYIPGENIFLAHIAIGLAYIIIVSLLFFFLIHAIGQWLAEMRNDIFFFREWCDQKRKEE